MIFLRRRKKKQQKEQQEREENERRVDAERQALEAELAHKHTSEMSELMSTNNGSLRTKYASGTSELVGSEQRHELRTVESPIELPGSPISRYPSSLGSPVAVSEMGSPEPSEISAGGRTAPGSPMSIATSGGYGNSPTLGHARIPSVPEEGLGIITSNVEWARHSHNERRRAYR